MNEEKAIQKKALLLTAAIMPVLLIAGGIYYILQQQRTIEEIKEAGALDKEMLQQEYNELSLQYEGYKFSINNDSLIAKLSTEQAKVRSLMEELKVVKSTNAKRIAELRKELETLRKIMRNYVVQIDSLNTANQQLRDENKAQREQINRVNRQKVQLEQERTALSKKVELAQKLSISGIKVTGLNSRGRTAKRISAMKQLKFDFSIDRNITTEPGMKTVYLRIYKPDDTLLTKSGEGTFEFEGNQISYSIARQVEYQGESVSLTLYWDIDEYLTEGTYRVEAFADGYLIGRTTFTLG